MSFPHADLLVAWGYISQGPDLTSTSMSEVIAAMRTLKKQGFDHEKLGFKEDKWGIQPTNNGDLTNTGMSKRLKMVRSKCGKSSRSLQGLQDFIDQIQEYLFVKSAQPLRPSTGVEHCWDPLRIIILLPRDTPLWQDLDQFEWQK